VLYCGSRGQYVSLSLSVTGPPTSLSVSLLASSHVVYSAHPEIELNLNKHVISLDSNAQKNTTNEIAMHNMQNF